MDIIIFGASGRTGFELVRQALFQGHSVTAFVRKQGRLQLLVDENLLVIEGDLNDLEQVRVAMRGKHAVISALGVSKTLHHDPEVVKAIATIVQAMRAESINRLIYLSVFLAGSTPGQFSFFVEKILKRIIHKEVHDHEAKEKIICGHTGAYTIVRATRLTDSPFTGKYRHGETIAIRNFLPSITRADVAHFILKQLGDGTYVKKAVRVTGNL